MSSLRACEEKLSHSIMYTLNGEVFFFPEVSITELIEDLFTASSLEFVESV